MSIVMLPPHRPSIPSTSTSNQFSSTVNVGIPLRQHGLSPPIAKDLNQDTRITAFRHRDKLELIRDSLKPFEQTVAAESQSSLANCDSFSAEDETRRQIMLNTLTQIGFEEEAAILALQLVRYSSVAAAAEVLLNIKKDHVFKQDAQKLSIVGVSEKASIPSVYAFSNNISSVTNALGPKGNQSQPFIDAVSHALGQNFMSTMCGNIDENNSSKSNSPRAKISGRSRSGSPHARAPSPSTLTHRPSSPNKLFHQFNNYHRTHANLTLSHSRYAAEFNVPSSSQVHFTSSLPSHMIEQKGTIVVNIEKNTPGKADRQLRPLLSAPMRSQVYEKVCLAKTDRIPVIRTHIERPQKAMLQIKVDSVGGSSSDSRKQNRYRLDVVDDITGDAVTVHGEPTGMTGVKSILIDPDKPNLPDFVDMVQLYRRTNKGMVPDHESKRLDINDISNPSDEFNNIYNSNSHVPNSYLVVGLASKFDVDGVNRSCSPLPDSIMQRVHSQTYQSSIKPCRPRLFRFYMEQHIERLIQQYKEREQRSFQLEKEMECAKLPEAMREQMLVFLCQKESRYLRLKRQKMDKSMFDVIKHIGFGAFGRVSLVRKKDSRRVYAMKTILKKDVIVKQQAAHVKAERDILAEANSQWIVKLYFSFQDDQSLYFIMEYVPGGDMMQLLITKKIFYEELAKFYIAELVCAVEYVHNLGFIHRDIKPDNILIDQIGHIKLSDFGLCTGLRWTHDKRFYDPYNVELEPSQSHTFVGNERLKVLDIRNYSKRNQSHSLVGTDNYMAPEIICCIGHSQLCDWWSVGVILYEMVFGRPPFLSEDRYETQFKIVNWRQFLDLNNRAALNLSAECINIIKRLCCDQVHRLGRENGAIDIKMHCWFEDIDFSTLRSTRAEYVPCVQHEEDTSNFDTFHLESADETFDTFAKRATASSSSLNPAFYEFTFRHFFDFDAQGCPSLRRTPHSAVSDESDCHQNKHGEPKRLERTHADLVDREHTNEATNESQLRVDLPRPLPKVPANNVFKQNNSRKFCANQEQRSSGALGEAESKGAMRKSSLKVMCDSTKFAQNASDDHRVRQTRLNMLDSAPRFRIADELRTIDVSNFSAIENVGLLQRNQNQVDLRHRKVPGLYRIPEQPNCVSQKIAQFDDKRPSKMYDSDGFESDDSMVV